MIWLWDNTAKRNIKRHRAHWAVVLGCIGLFVLRTRMNRAFVPFSVSFQIIIQIIVASFVPILHFLSKSKRHSVFAFIKNDANIIWKSPRAFSFLIKKCNLGTNDAKIIWNIIWNKPKNGTKSAVQSRMQHEQPNTAQYKNSPVCPVSLYVSLGCVIPTYFSDKCLGNKKTMTK